MTPDKEKSSSIFNFLNLVNAEALQDSLASVETIVHLSEKADSQLETPQRKGTLLSRCENCSICWSPLCKPVTGALFPPHESRESGEESEDYGESKSQSVPSEPIEPRSPLANQKSTTQTRCGHIFHTKCLMETKLRKAECPNCRCQLTPITDPLHVSSAMQADPALYTSSLRDAVIHAAHRGRNAVRLALEARLCLAEAQRKREEEQEQEQEQERKRLQAQEVQTPLTPS